MASQKDSNNPREHCATIIAVRNLADKAFQSLLNYTSSRCRAIGFTFVLRQKSMGDREWGMFLEQFQTELVRTLIAHPSHRRVYSQSIQTAANILVGLGVTIHDSRVYPPYTLRAMTQLMLAERLASFEDVLKVAQDEREQDDRILPEYQANWWSHFPTTTIDITAKSIIDAWKTQVAALPTPVLLSRQSRLSINALPDSNVAEAIIAGRDALRLMDTEIKRNALHLEQVADTLRKLRVLRARLGKLEEAGLQKEMALLSRGL